MSQQTQEKINPDLREFPANALIVTSRIDEKFKGVDINIDTLRFDGGKLAYFIEQYLKQCGKWDLFEADQEEFLQECAQLARIVGEQKTITVLLAKLYAERMINAKQGFFASGRSLDNIPDLILAHVEKLNRQGERNTKNEYPTVKQDAKVIAWKCLEQSYKPSPVDREAVVKALGSNNAVSCLEYFEKHLRLLKSIGYAEERKDRDKIRFALDPLAEYLAALYLIQDDCKDDGEKWRTFLAEIEKKSGNLEEIKGFLLAVRDCCLAKGSEVRVPSFVVDELGKLAGLDLEALEQERQQQRIKRLLRNLFAPEATVEDRVDDLTKIGESGSVAKFAAPALVQFLKNDYYFHVRKVAAETLGNLGNVSESVMQGLLALLKDDDSQVRSSAADALGNLGNASESVMQGLLALLKDDDSQVRSSAARALGNLGNASELVVQSLVALLKNDDSQVRSSAARALGNLGNASKLVVQSLVALLKDDNSQVRYSAAEALGNLGNASESVIQGLLALLKDDDWRVRKAGAEALGNLGNASESVRQELVALLKDGDWRVRKAGAEVLGNLGNASESVIQGLVRLLQDDYWRVRKAGAKALGNLGNASESVIQGLVGLLQDDHWHVHSSAARALGNLGNTSEPVVRGLWVLLQDDNSDDNSSVYSSAAEALAKLGHPSEPIS